MCEHVPIEPATFNHPLGPSRLNFGQGMIPLPAGS